MHLSTNYILHSLWCGVTSNVVCAIQAPGSPHGDDQLNKSTPYICSICQQPAYTAAL